MKTISIVTGMSRAQLIEIFVRHMVRKAAAIIGYPGQPFREQLKLKSLRCHFRVSKVKSKRTSD